MKNNKGEQKKKEKQQITQMVRSIPDPGEDWLSPSEENDEDPSWKETRLAALLKAGYQEYIFREPVLGLYYGVDAYCPRLQVFLFLIDELDAFHVMYAMALRKEKIRCVVIVNGKNVHHKAYYYPLLLEQMAAFIEIDGKLYEPVTNVVSGYTCLEEAWDIEGLFWFNAYSSHLEKKAA